MRDLQAFLIKRFIYILVLVTVAQSLISFLISQAVMPVVMKVFFPGLPEAVIRWKDGSVYFYHMCSVIADSKCRPDAFAITAAGNDAVDRGKVTGLAGQCTSGDKEFRRRTGDGRMESHPAVCGSSAVNGVYAASLYFGCDNVRADCDGGISSDPGGARTAAERV